MYLRLTLGSGSIDLYRRTVTGIHEASDYSTEMRFAVGSDGSIYIDNALDLEKLAQDLLQPLVDSFMPTST